MTQETNTPGQCPSCEEKLRTVSFGIYWSSITDHSEVSSHWQCNKCGASWTEYYKVTVDSMGDFKSVRERATAS